MVLKSTDNLECNKCLTGLWVQVEIANLNWKLLFKKGMILSGVRHFEISLDKGNEEPQDLGNL